MAVGLLVFVVWVGLETAWVGRRWPALQRVYLGFTGGICKLGGASAPAGDMNWAPVACGWPLITVRLLGSALVIATIEEFFWRGFLYRFRWHGSFLETNLGAFSGTRFALVACLFGMEHGRWVAGIVAGAAYALLAIRTKDIWTAVVAHGVTNLALGLYVLATRSYQFW